MSLGIENFKIYSIVVTYNGQEWIEKCLNSLLNSSIVTDIIIIDNCSTDQTIEIINSKFKNCHLIQNEENLGFGKANNIGLSLALENNADFAFLLNQDAWVKKDTIEKLIIAQRNEPEYAVISPIQLNKDGSGLEVLFSQFIAPNKCPKLYSDIYVKNVKPTIYGIEFVNAAAWLITKKCMNEIGGFSPIFYHYGEDNNYCFRVHFHGLKVGVLATTEIFHAKETYDSQLEHEDLVKERQKLMLYSDPSRYTAIDKDIHINKMSAFKSLIKFDIANFKSFKEHKKHLVKLKESILPDVQTSLIKGPNFLQK